MDNWYWPGSKVRQEVAIAGYLGRKLGAKQGPDGNWLVSMLTMDLDKGVDKGVDGTAGWPIHWCNFVL
jgi:hypothetical protein